MKRRDFIKTTALGATGAVLGAQILQAEESKGSVAKYKIEAQYSIDFDSAEHTSLFIPMPSVVASNVHLQGNHASYKSMLNFGVPYLQVDFLKSAQKKQFHLSYEIASYQLNERLFETSDFVAMGRYERDDASVANIANQLKGTTPKESVRNFYAFIKHEMPKRQKALEGKENLPKRESLPWFATISKESMFVSLCHACGIKSAEVQGLKLAQNSVVKNAPRVEVYLKDSFLAFDFQNNHKEVFIPLNRHKDMQLDSALLATFGDAFALVDGRDLGNYESKLFEKRVSYTIV
ncbi:twin-arginine translocation signal domain-containing protein [Helicobacter pylori]|uniref:twin-arginine translocation signal domain-containing protein n=1 Tax=Helicobacter pylori TaxID=210 RepID=UPI001FD03239|nr:twin-arginine translocation signal domain-containing protein [Helicobacter pylori]UOR38305.1 twin-arginine translocation signal domain-containing protein [Helicobacter pylori]